VVVALLLASGAAGDGGTGGAELADRIRPSVVQLVDRAPNGEVRASGSGFIASPDGLIITNHHVYAALNTAIEVRFADGGSVPVSGMLMDDEKQDVAVLKIEGEGWPALALDDSEPKVGSYAALLAAPAGLTWTFAEGSVAAFRPDGMPKELLEDSSDETLEADKLPLVQFTLSSAGGASGGPIVNQHGAVIAIVRSGLGHAGMIMFGIPAKALIERLTRSKVARVESVGPPRWRNLGISAAFFLGLSVWWVYRSRARRY
jgi:S1-C subfamily serine protease